MKYICNPMNIDYKYQFIDGNGVKSISREAADPSMILFKGTYYLFASMTTGFFTSDNLMDWEFHKLKDMPVYDYAPDVRVIGDYIYFSASKRDKNCSFFRSKDPVNEPFEEVAEAFPFWDPNLFVDDDGRLYFYWGCSNVTPIYGVELNLSDMKPKSEPIALISGNDKVIGYERSGENHISQITPEAIENRVQGFIKQNPNISEESIQMLRQYLSSAPYIEGAWMDKHNDRYYLQYSCPGTQYNVYADGVYIANSPLGLFTLAKNNPYSYKPGGFIPGAGHGSTLRDKYGNLWHAATMRISVNHIFERRLGLWPAGFDKDGELFCNQRYGDWPLKIEQAKMNPWGDPEWMLLSYNKPAKASSFEKGKDALKAVDENVQTWWKAAGKNKGEWLEIDLKHVCDVHAVQINFADDKLDVQFPQESMNKLAYEQRFIDESKHYTRWILEASTDGTEYSIIEDKSHAKTNLPHDLVVLEHGIKVRFLRCTVLETPYNQNACISGLRVFGIGEGDLPQKASGVKAELPSELDLFVSWDDSSAVGNNVLWGYAPDKLYHSYMVLGQNNVKIGALIKGEPLFIRVDAFNEKGITEGDILEVTAHNQPVQLSKSYE